MDAYGAPQPVRCLTAIGDGCKGFSVIFRDEEHKVLVMYDIIVKGEEVSTVELWSPSLLMISSASRCVMASQ